MSCYADGQLHFLFMFSRYIYLNKSPIYASVLKLCTTTLTTERCLGAIGALMWRSLRHML